MKSLLFLMLFMGIIFVIDGVYQDEINTLKNKKKIEYRIVPRAMYDDMVFVKGTDSSGYANLFEDNFEYRGVGRY
jgi:hypothetical protein